MKIKATDKGYTIKVNAQEADDLITDLEFLKGILSDEAVRTGGGRWWAGTHMEPASNKLRKCLDHAIVTVSEERFGNCE